MNAETLTFRANLDTQQATQATEAPANALDLVKLDLETLALAKFRESEEALKTAKETLKGVVHDLSTTTKLNDAKSLRQRLINAPLADARKMNTGLKSKLAAVSKAIGGKLTEIEEGFNAADKLITPQIEAREAEIAEEKRIAAEKEAERVAAIQSRIDSIKACAVRAQAPDMTSERINKGIAQVEAIAIDDSFAEFKATAEEAKTTTLAAMRNLAATAKAREDEAARIEAQRVENERIAAEQKKEADRMAAERAEFERQKAELAAQQKAIDDAKAEEAEKLRREQEAAERQRVEAERKAAEEVAATEARIKASEVLVGAHDLRPASLDMTHAAARIVTPAVISDLAERFVPTAQKAIHPAAQALRNEAPTLALGEICRRLGFTVTDDLLTQLGYPVEAVIKGAKLRRQSQFGDICNALIRHIEAAAAEAVLAA